MSASPAAMDRANETRSNSPGKSNRNERIEVPVNWRIGQGVVLAFILLLCAYYNKVGWISPPGETGTADTRTVFDQVGFVILAALVLLTTPTAGVIATTTFQEAIRRRWMTAMLAFGVVILALSTFFTWMQPGEEEKFLSDFGIGFIIIITLLMSIFLGVALIPPEIERRTIFTILSKPVERWEFIIGKYLGLCLTLLVNLGAMSLMFLIAYAMYAVRRDPNGIHGAMDINTAANHPGLVFTLRNLSYALILHFGELAIMAALALMLSLIISNITAIVFCFIAYFGGQMSSYWEHLKDQGQNESGKGGLSGPMQGFVKVVYLILPRLDRFDVRERLVNDMPVAFNYLWKSFGAVLIYVAVLLTIAYLVFSDREF